MSERDDSDDAAVENGGDEESPDETAIDETPSSEASASETAGEKPGPDEQYCSSCGEIIKKEAEICPHCGVRQKSATPSGSKDRTTAGILALLLGGIGAHKFYLGETGLGVLYLCFSWTLIPAIVGFIEGLLYLTKTDEEFQRQYVND
jgi:TM2 domain-containing membrane protein YozV